ncbi:MAG: adenine deaminase [Chitinophagaceae bacterium]|nr:adenine deaminase [Chitinophagaceae bacterium]
MKISGNIVNVAMRQIFPGEITIENGQIVKIRQLDECQFDHFIMPGFVDAHVHIESSMLVPSEFARIAVIHGTVATVSDPHEIANVLGIEGVEYMIENALQVPFHFHFGAPSCVPATSFETSGATLDERAVEQLLQRKEIGYLSEMMNYPGVLAGDEAVTKKIDAANRLKKPIDGHAPGLTGAQAEKYIAAGISTDHECFTYEEGLFKIMHGMKVLIREGSAAKNFDALIPLLNDFPDMIMFCSDDKHPNDLVKGHINQLVSKALALNIDLWKVLRAVTLNPVTHYNLSCGLLNEGDSADFIVVNNLTQFKVLQTYIKGHKVAEEGKSLMHPITSPIVNQFNCKEKIPADFQIRFDHNLLSAEKDDLNLNRFSVRVIEASDGQLITGTTMVPLTGLYGNDGCMVPDIKNDILKLTVVNRYTDAMPARAFIKNMGIKRGAIASSVAHDCHNILATGVSDELICKAVNALIRTKGGLAVVTESEELVLPLPVAGIMTNVDAFTTATAYEEIDASAKALGSKLTAPFMTLSFMALLVIPQLKLSDKGLFDGTQFAFVNLLVLS